MFENSSSTLFPFYKLCLNSFSIPRVLALYYWNLDQYIYYEIERRKQCFVANLKRKAWHLYMRLFGWFSKGYSLLICSVCKQYYASIPERHPDWGGLGHIAPTACFRLKFSLNDQTSHLRYIYIGNQCLNNCFGNARCTNETCQMNNSITPIVC